MKKTKQVRIEYKDEDGHYRLSYLIDENLAETELEEFLCEYEEAKIVDID